MATNWMSNAWIWQNTCSCCCSSFICGKSSIWPKVDRSQACSKLESVFQFLYLSFFLKIFKLGMERCVGAKFVLRTKNFCVLSIANEIWSAWLLLPEFNSEMVLKQWEYYLLCCSLKPKLSTTSPFL